MIILGIETSCDETAVSVVHGNRGLLTIKSHVVSSQIKTHRRYGGVVPEVAARHHVINITPVVAAAMEQAKLKPTQLDAIAVTRGPGLITSLRVGVQAAKTLSYAWSKPLVGVNHMEGHIAANWLGKPNYQYPTVCLVVSGGHTELILVKKQGDYHLIGRTRDDAAGEAFDKVGKLLKLGYPGGPKIQEYAARGNPTAIDFPRPMLTDKNYDFSFSGLKTSALYLLQKKQKIPLPDFCASFQQAIVDVLVQKTIRAAKEYRAQTVLLAGGVAANAALRTQLQRAVKRELKNVQFGMPPFFLCTDNASMIAMAGYFHAVKQDFDRWDRCEPDPVWELV